MIDRMLEWLIDHGWSYLPLVGFFFQGCNCCEEDTATPTASATDETASATFTGDLTGLTIQQCCEPATPFIWSVTVDGIGPDEECEDCTAFNGTYLLRYVGGCVWESDEAPLCFVGFPTGRYQLTMTGGNSLRLTAQGDATPICDWRKTSGIDCLGPNTLTLVAGTGDCNCNTAPTVTVIPF